jgi:hypothetical protein
MNMNLGRTIANLKFQRHTSKASQHAYFRGTEARANLARSYFNTLGHSFS